MGEIGLLTGEQQEELSKLLARFGISEGSLKKGGVKYFVETKEQLLKVYSFRLKNAKRNVLKEKLARLTENLSVSSETMICVSFLGEKPNRAMIFSDIGFTILYGIINKEE